MIKPLTTIALVALCLPTSLFAADRLDLYPLDTCAVAKRSKLGSMGDPIVQEVEGREYRLCCKKCDGKLTGKTEAVTKSVDERIIAQQKPYYPLDTCVVSGEKLGDDAVDFVVKNALVRTCCNNCARKVQGDPDKFLAKLDQAIVAQQSKNYPLRTCAVSGEPLDEGDMKGKTVEVIVGNRLVKVCCKGCLKGLKKDPAAVLAAVEAGWKEAKGGASKKGESSKKPGMKGHEGHDH